MLPDRHSTIQDLIKAAQERYFVFKHEEFPAKTIISVFDDSFEYCHGVELPYIKTKDIDFYWKWCNDMFGPSGYEVSSLAKTIWFKEEKNKTLFILKWS